MQNPPDYSRFANTIGLLPWPKVHAGIDGEFERFWTFTLLNRFRPTKPLTEYTLEINKDIDDFIFSEDLSYEDYYSPISALKLVDSKIIMLKMTTAFE